VTTRVESLAEVIVYARMRNRERRWVRFVLNLPFTPGARVQRESVAPERLPEPEWDGRHGYWPTLDAWERDMIALDARLRETSRKARVAVWLPLPTELAAGATLRPAWWRAKHARTVAEGGDE
jgi:hypothetical protein